MNTISMQRGWVLSLKEPRSSCWDQREERWIARAHQWHIFKLSVFEETVEPLREFILAPHEGYLCTTMLVDHERANVHVALGRIPLGHLLAFSDPGTAMLFRLTFVGESIG